MRLSELRTGEKGVIVKVMGRGAFRKRIIEMGFIRGKEVDVIQNAPLKDPIHYRVMGYDVSLRRNDAQMIEVVSVAEFIEASTGKQENRPVDSYIQTSGKSLQAMAMHKGKTINVALVGNPNCGKTSLFNFASGAHEHVGNYSGVTVDAKAGTFHQNGYTFKIVDLPGTYSLSAYTPEELYVRKHLNEEQPDIVINVVDASNLERNLYLTCQLIDMSPSDFPRPQSIPLRRGYAPVRHASPCGRPRQFPGRGRIQKSRNGRQASLSAGRACKACTSGVRYAAA